MFPGARLESSLKFRGREEVVAGQDQGGDASELRLGLMSSVWRKGCIPAVSGRESRTHTPNMVNFPHQPRSYLDRSLWVSKEIRLVRPMFERRKGQEYRRPYAYIPNAVSPSWMVLFGDRKITPS